MPPERSTELVEQLRTWCKNGTMRQMDLAAQLGLRPQQLAEILAGRNRPTAEQILTIQDFLKDPMSTTVPDPARTRQKASPDDDPINYMSTEKHASWGETREALGEAQQEIIRLRAQLTASPNGSQRSSHVMLPTPTPKPAVPEPALPAAKPTLPPASTLAFDSTDPKTWTGRSGTIAFPATCDSPKAIAEYISGLSTEALRSHLKGAPKKRDGGAAAKIRP